MVGTTERIVAWLRRRHSDFYWGPWTDGYLTRLDDERASRPCPHCNDEGVVHDMAGNGLGPCDCTPDPYQPCPFDSRCGVDACGVHDPWCTSERPT